MPISRHCRAVAADARPTIIAAALSALSPPTIDNSSPDNAPSITANPARGGAAGATNRRIQRRPRHSRRSSKHGAEHAPAAADNDSTAATMITAGGDTSLPCGNCASRLNGHCPAQGKGQRWPLNGGRPTRPGSIQSHYDPSRSMEPTTSADRSSTDSPTGIAAAVSEPSLSQTA